jgi:glycosyltransferase involved in cell wall biosynthesis
MCDTAISADYFAHGPRSFEELSGAFKLLWVGRMLTRKALPFALDAVREVRQNVTLTIAGDGIDPSVVHQMIRDRNLQHRVFWKGDRLTWTELRSAYAAHDAMIFTSLRDSFGSQVLEAMAMGLPIITLDLHGAHDWVPNEASLKAHVGAPEETVRNFADAIDKCVLRSPAQKQQMSMHAWNFARTQSWSARAEFCERLYQNVLSGAAASEGVSSSKLAAFNI